MRRVVTGHDQAGRSVIVSDGTSPRSVEIKGVPGMATALAWSTEPGGHNTEDTTLDVRDFIPSPGGSRLILLTLPPDAVYGSEDFDPILAGQEQLAASPGLAERFEPDNPGMHTTPTVDYGFVISGRAVLEVDDGATVELTAGDLVVQNGTRHAWRNPYNEPVQFAFVLLGENGAES
jgi:mannose-6-phosphate isomerase-like protein (cupin superfamily)